MSKSISILDKDYLQWVDELIKRYQACQIRAAVKVNAEQLRFNWLLGHDIVEMNIEQRWGESVMEQLSRDLKKSMPQTEGLSVTNLRYCRRFYQLYSQADTIRPQVEGETIDASAAIHPQAGGEMEISDSLSKKYGLFNVPWGHQKLILDKVKGDVNKALFYVRQVQENGWSRAMLLNFITTDLYERQGKALTNFQTTLPDADSGLAQELTKDPYSFAFTGITKPYNERILKDALLNNITHFLTELGTGFAYVGKEYRLQVGETENFIDLLFYNLNLSCYVVIEVKIGKFEFADVGQLGGYVVACNHLLRKEGRDNPTIGLLICKEKDRVQAQYALESSSQPLGISEYDLEKFYPEKVEGTIPTVAEIEAKLSN
jgi:predicted nuclease of restriction endonuclease-like (RecB) superfamily